MIPKPLTSSVLVALGLTAAGAVALPDLSGTWDFRTEVPLEAPEKPPTPEEAAKRASRPPSVWSDNGSAVPADRRPSLIVDPADGRLPALRQGAAHQKPGDELSEAAGGPGTGNVLIRVGGLGTDGPEERGLAERCLQGFSTGPPIVPGHYNQNLRIVQTESHVLLLAEMIHDARAVRLGGEHEPASIKRWLGDSVASWHGDTLVIRTKNFPAKVASFAPNAFVAMGNAAQLELEERLLLRDANTLEYEYTVTDPATFTQPFTARLLMRRTEAKLFEYACHEGNKPLRHILMAARAEEKEGHETVEPPD